LQKIFVRDEDIAPNTIPITESMGDSLNKSWLNLLKTSLANSDKKLANAVYKSKLDDMRSDYACNSFYDLSARGYAQYTNFEGEEFTNLKNGYIKLIDYLKSKLSKNMIKLSEPVRNVDYSSNIINVKTSKNVYKAKYVIMTVSLGILKSNYMSLFSPALPSAKINAINNLGFGVVNKLFFVFDKPIFYDNTVSGVQFLWANDTSFELSQNVRCNLSPEFSQFYKSFNIY